MSKKSKGIKIAQKMREWADRKGGFEETPDGFDRSDPSTLASLVDAWGDWLQTRNYAQSTLQTHRWSLRMFLRWAEERDLRYPKQITKLILENYQRWLARYRKDNGKPLGYTTQRSRLGALQRFFTWLCKQNKLEANPAADLELPRKPPHPLNKALNRDEIKAIMGVPDIRDPLGIRDRAVLELFYSTGMRRTELVRLDVEDLDLKRAVVLIRKGKGGKSRVLPLGEQARYWLERYLDHARVLLEVSAGERALFLTGYGGRFNPNALGNIVTKIIKEADISQTGSCHLLRHACATHMLENGADVRVIQQLLGHSRLDTTQIYTDVSIKLLREVHTRTHPSANLKKR